MSRLRRNTPIERCTQMQSIGVNDLLVKTCHNLKRPMKHQLEQVNLSRHTSHKLKGS